MFQPARSSAWARILCFAALAATGCGSLNLAPVASVVRSDREPPQPLPSKKSVRVSQFVFVSDFELARDLPLFQELGQMREQVQKELQLPNSNALIQVYLFEDRERYERFMHARYPELPKRRAFFVAQPKPVGGPEDLLVYTYWGDRVQQDLRHELTHALLHSVLKDVPLWLDEGLAEYYEVPADHQGVNYRHLEQLRRALVQTDLPRLEQMNSVQQMSPSEYRESWAWVHLLLKGKPEGKAVLVAYLQLLRSTPNPGPLSPRLASVYPVLNDALDKHLVQMDAQPRSTAAASKSE